MLAAAMGASVAAAASAGYVYGAPEPYQWMHGANPTALPARSASPDPLVRYTWDASIDSSTLQQLEITSAVAVHAVPESAFEGLASLTDPSSQNVSLLVKAPGWLRLDFGLERPAWLEGISTDLNTTGQAHLLRASISEYDEPYDTKTQPVKTYPGNTFRLETPHPSKDGQLYEGVRYAWLCFAVDCPWTGGDAAPTPPAAPPSGIKPWRLTALRLVAKFQPVSYTGSFTSSDPRLEKVWYTGAYGIRSNMVGDIYVIRRHPSL
jgi:alpha-L-rhamnosidase